MVPEVGHEPTVQETREPGVVSGGPPVDTVHREVVVASRGVPSPDREGPGRGRRGDLEAQVGGESAGRGHGVTGEIEQVGRGRVDRGGPEALDHPRVAL